MMKNLEIDEIKFILQNNYIGHLAYIYLGRPFAVPITYYYDEQINAIICYSGEGHKVMAMRKDNAVSLQVSDITSVNQWKSVLVHGKFEQHFGSDAKAYLHQFSIGVKDLITKKEHKRPDFISDFSSKIYREDVPIVFLIKIEEMTGKKRNF
jgi:nitroimidazol reductase NimA-like FMN-containing flavoprotein (pyridoxamine 5'-phosphate oxidase superfamily)